MIVSKKMIVKAAAAPLPSDGGKSAQLGKRFEKGETHMEYRLACCEEKKKIIAFMDAYWGSRHPILHKEEYFQYYFCTHKDRLNFALALEGESICAVCGFTPCNEACSEIWISLWQAAPKKNGVGLELMSRMLSLTGAQRMSCNNIRPETQVFYQFLGYETGELKQYYRLGTRMDFQLAQPENLQRPEVDRTVYYRRVSSFAELCACAELPSVSLPQKDLWYVQRRFFQFPGYAYELYGLYEKGRIRALLAVRPNPVNDRCVLRIVDYWGTEEDFGRVGGTIEALLEQYRAEYADLYCTGLSQQALTQAGFTLREHGSRTVIPNYLNPPVACNTDYFYFTSDPTDFRMFRADGDQDRPNCS